MPARTSLTLAALSSLLLATPALANRAGDAPIKAPLNLKTHHIAFTLPGGVWKQKVGAAGGNPAFGRYGLDFKLPDGSVCQLTADVLGKTSARPFVAHGNTVQLRPFSQFPELLHITSRGGHGGVGYWAGTMKNFDAAAGGTQRLPAGLRTKAKPYLNYNVRILHANPRAGDPCGALARKNGARVAREIARTMHIANGPPVSAPPFVSS
jgi:hypothetical protein